MLGHGKNIMCRVHLKKFREDTMISCKLQDLHLKMVQIHLGAHCDGEYSQVGRFCTNMMDFPSKNTGRGNRRIVQIIIRKVEYKMNCGQAKIISFLQTIPDIWGSNH